VTALLLGTWAGPGWDPKVSTVLQVLVSIQSLILCEEPFNNEPGHNSASGSMESRRYNATCRYHTICHAMIPALKRVWSGGRGDPFREVLRLHFRHKLTEFVALLVGFSVQAEPLPSPPSPNL
jgi:hypothetical protein